jgi:hypothetical protein
MTIGAAPPAEGKVGKAKTVAFLTTKRSFMNGNSRTPADRDALLETFAAELTLAAYRVALRHGAGGAWLDLELELWRVLTEMVEKWERERPRAAGRPEAAHDEGRDGLGHGRDARLYLSGE